MTTKYLLVERKYDKARCVAQYKVDKNGEFMRSYGVYLAELINKTSWFDYPETPYGKTKNISYAIYGTLEDMLQDNWVIVKS